MTVKHLLSGVIYAGTVAGALSGLGVFAHFAVVRPLRAFLRREIVTNLVDIKDAVGILAERLERHITGGRPDHGERR